MDNPSKIEERLQELEDSEKIRQRLAEFFVAIDSKDVGRLSAQLTEDVEFIWLQNRWVGKKAIAEFYSGFFQQYPNAYHVTGNVIVKCQGEVATATAYWVWFADGKQIKMWGHDEYRLRKEANVWKVKEARVVPALEF